MRKNSRIRGSAPLLAALTLVVSLPELARAQHTGLFPLAPIKRQRVPCDQEDPIYKVYKHQYFGYHPTCWRPFPAGWGCPSPEAPDKEKSFAEIKPGGADREPGGERPDEEGMDAQPNAPRPTRPALPGGARSPFEDTDTDKPAAPGTPRGNQGTLPTPPGDPFEMDKPEAPAAPRPGTARPNAPGAANNAPELSAPAEQPGTIQGVRSTQNETASGDTDDTAPVLSLPTVNVPPINDAGVPFGTDLPPRRATDAASIASSTATNSNAAPQPRRGLLSGFFNNLGLNWVRR